MSIKNGVVSTFSLPLQIEGYQNPRSFFCVKIILAMNNFNTLNFKLKTGSFANANKYTWEWKKATEKSRYRLFEKITALFQEINEELAYTGMKLCINTEYAPEYIREAAEKYVEVWQLDETQFKHGRGHHKTVQQRHYEKLMEYAQKLEEYVEKIRICGEGRNSCSKTDHSATFMRIKTDYMGND